MARDLLEVFRAATDRQPNAPAFTFIGSRHEPYSYEELFASADRIAKRLNLLKVPTDAPVGLLLHKQEDQVLHYLAAHIAGLVPAILTPPNPKLNQEYYMETVTRVLATCRLSAVITDVNGLELQGAMFRPYDIEPINNVRPAATNGPRLDAALLQFSSGTTGIKRGVFVTQESVLAQIDVYGSAIGLSSSDVIVSWLALYHDMGFIACLNMPLAYGAHTVMIDPMTWVVKTSTFLTAASDHRATLAWNPNFAYAFMAERVSDKDAVQLEIRRADEPSAFYALQYSHVSRRIAECALLSECA